MADKIVIEIYKNKDADELTKLLAEPQGKLETGSGAALSYFSDKKRQADQAWRYCDALVSSINHHQTDNCPPPDYQSVCTCLGKPSAQYQSGRYAAYQ